jgi:hypothetical protein
MMKGYHRRWHTGHGRFCSMMRIEELEAARARLFGVSSHLYKQAFLNSLAWLKFTLTGNSRMAFRTEIKLRFFLGFYRQRRSEYLAERQHGLVREVATFVRSLATGTEFRVKTKPPTPDSRRSTPETRNSKLETRNLL